MLNILSETSFAIVNKRKRSRRYCEKDLVQHYTQLCSCWWPSTTSYQVICKYSGDRYLIGCRGPPSLLWRHNGQDGVSNHQPHECLLNRSFRRRSKLRVTGLCVGNSSETGEFPAQRASKSENVSIWWRHHVRDQNWKCPTNFARSWIQGLLVSQ